MAAQSLYKHLRADKRIVFMDQLQLTKRKVCEYAYCLPKRNFSLLDKNLKMDKIYLIAGASAERGIEHLAIEHSATNQL